MPTFIRHSGRKEQKINKKQKKEHIHRDRQIIYYTKLAYTITSDGQKLIRKLITGISVSFQLWLCCLVCMFYCVSWSFYYCANKRINDQCLM